MKGGFNLEVPLEFVADSVTGGSGATQVEIAACFNHSLVNNSAGTATDSSIPQVKDLDFPSEPSGEDWQYCEVVSAADAENTIVSPATVPTPNRKTAGSAPGQVLNRKVLLGPVPQSMLTSCAAKEKELPAEIPLIIRVRSLTCKGGYASNDINALWLMCSTQPSSGSSANDSKDSNGTSNGGGGSDVDVLVLKRVVVRSGRGYLLQPLFGNVQPPERIVSAMEAEGKKQAPVQECVVCLTEPRSVVVLHCKHVCLCRQCASVTSSTWSYQCPICRGRVAAFVGLDEE